MKASILFSRNQNYIKQPYIYQKSIIINSFYTFKSNEATFAKIMCFTYSVQYFLVFVTLPTPRVDMNQSQGRLRPSLLL